MSIFKVIQFLKTDIWRIRERDFSRSKWFLIRQLRVLILSLRGFADDRCQLRASSLTFYSLLSVVPVVAMVFGIAKGFGFERTLEKQLLEKLEVHGEVVRWIIGFAHALLETTRGGFIAGIGVVILFWAVIKVLSNIENAFNDIWGIKKPRSFGRKISDYLSLMLICPFLFVISSTTTVFIVSQVKLIISKIELLGLLSPVISVMLKLLPFCALWTLFTFIYVFIPNTKVNFRSATLAGIISGTLYQISQVAYIKFQIGVAKYNAIYGSFAALPLFLIWMQLSWLIVLLGAEMSFAHQNADTYEFEQDCLKVSHSFKKLLGLRIVHLLVKHFSNTENPYNESHISHKLEIPIRLVRQILGELVESGIIARIKANEDRDLAYQPARNTETMTIKYVIDALEERGTDTLPVAESEELKKLSECLKTFVDLIDKSPANKRLQDI